MDSTLGHVLRAAAALALVAVAALAGTAMAVSSEDFPRGLLFVSTRGPFEGTQGSGCLAMEGTELCVDGPRIAPSSGPHAAPGASMRFTPSDGWTISEHSVGYFPADDEAADSTSLESRLDGDDVTFDGPPTGDWVVEVFVRFERADASGDAVYYFRIMAGPPDSSTISGDERVTGPNGFAVGIVVIAAVLVAALFTARRRTVS